jgi:hypothetical protein
MRSLLCNSCSFSDNPLSLMKAAQIWRVWPFARYCFTAIAIRNSILLIAIAAVNISATFAIDLTPQQIKFKSDWNQKVEKLSAAGNPVPAKSQQEFANQVSQVPKEQLKDFSYAPFCTLFTDIGVIWRLNWTSDWQLKIPHQHGGGGAYSQWKPLASEATLWSEHVQSSFNGKSTFY